MIQQHQRSEPHTIDDMLVKYLGHIGPYQWQIFLMALLPIFIAGTLCTAMVFTTNIPQHRCLIPNCDSNISKIVIEDSSSQQYGSSFFNQSFLKFAIPLTMDHSLITSDSDHRYDDCHSYGILNQETKSLNESCSPSSFDSKTIQTCSNYVFEQRYFESTFVTDFQLYCDNEWIVQLLQVLYFFGNLIGAVSNGVLADKYGRRFIFRIYSPLTVICILMSSLTPNIWLYGIGMFIKGTCVAAIYQSAFAITMECLGGKWRFWLGILSSLSFTVGAIYVCICAWWLRRWRLIEFSNLLPALIMLAYPFIMPESIRWQYSSGQHVKAMDQMMAAAKKNGSKTPSLNKEILDVFITSKSKENEEKKGSIQDLFKHRTIRLWTLAFLFIWFTNALVYFGLSFLAHDIHSNIYLSMVLLMIIEFPAVVIAGYVGNITRKYYLIGILILGGFCSMGASFAKTGGWIKMSTAIMGKMSITGSFALIFVYSGEIFPTPLRTTGIGLCSFAARIAAMTAPYLLRLNMYGDSIPFLVIGLFTLTAGMVTIILPETKGKKLPDSMADVERLRN